MTASLFGLDLRRLFDALAASEGAPGNPLGVPRERLADLGRAYGCRFSPAALADRRSSENLVLAFWDFFGSRYERSARKPPTAGVLARMLRFGPSGWKSDEAAGWWRRVGAGLE